jgi:hypothetical protein
MHVTREPTDIGIRTTSLTKEVAGLPATQGNVDQ